MKYSLVKGTTAQLVSTVYTDSERTVKAILTGATLTATFKSRWTDLDVDALFTVTPTVLDAAEGLIETAIPANETNNLGNPVIYFEIVVKMAAGNIIRSGVQQLVLQDHALNTLP